MGPCAARRTGSSRWVVARPRCSTGGMSPDEQSPSIEVVENPGELQYEIRVGGELAGKAVYERHGDRRTFTHTEIDPAFEGKGLGGKLAAGALADVRARHLTVVPQCPFILSYLQRHPDLLDLVEEPYRTELGESA